MKSIQKVAIWLGAILTIPVSLILASLIANPFYMRFQFEGDRRDFAPGDAIGVLLDTCFFAAILLIPAMLGWWRLYRGVSSRSPKIQA
jgi:hypothetical protein